VWENEAMQSVHVTMPSAAENVALDEALLDDAEEGSGDDEFLRIWESPDPFVVAGRSTRISAEINEPECQTKRIPILRRSSGGAAIVAGPGCLMYALVISHKRRPELLDITRAHRFVLNRIVESIQPLIAQSGSVQVAGTSDLVLDDGVNAPRKFSGNSLRVKRSHFLYHGTILYDFDLSLISRCLRLPPRQPEYRRRRAHPDFVVNLPADRQELVDALSAAWPTTSELKSVPLTRVKELVASRFGQRVWSFERP
jgi:lipoate-protein ligase A